MEKGEINKIFDETEKSLDYMADKHYKKIETAIKNLEKKIINLSKDLPSLSGSMQFELKQLQEYHKELIKQFSDIYGGAVNSIIAEYDKVDEFLLTELKEIDIAKKFTKIDKEMFEALKAQSQIVFNDIGDKAANDLMQAVYNSAIGGDSFSDLAENIRNILIGVEGMAGKPLSSISSTFAQDSLMEYFAQINHIKTEQAGLDTYVYYGNIIKSSRPFCIARAGKVFTKKQIEDWNNYNWKGKKRGNIWVTRGGYNCRHHFRGVRKEWVENGQLDVNSYYEENPQEYDAKLQKEVEKEKKRL